jgi:hypothetical protein
MKKKININAPWYRSPDFDSPQEPTSDFWDPTAEQPIDRYCDTCEHLSNLDGCSHPQMMDTGPMPGPRYVFPVQGPEGSRYPMPKWCPIQFMDTFTVEKVEFAKSNCPECGGSGQVEANIAATFIGRTYKPCPHCEGTGKVQQATEVEEVSSVELQEASKLPRSKRSAQSSYKKEAPTGTAVFATKCSTSPTGILSTRKLAAPTAIASFSST